MPDAVKKKPKKSFVSYSWTSQEHEHRIIQICERLVNDGVDIILDKWELKEGDEKYAFMERMVTDPNVNKVLIFCDKQYAEKADSKKGGVGTESQIISKKIYDQVKQDKFIPVIFELKDNGEPYLPVFLQSRIYIDFTTPQNLNENYEQLLRAIFDQPLFKKPLVGKPPSYIFDKETSYVSTRSGLQSFKNSLIEDKSNYVPLARSYITDFLSTLENFRLPSSSTSNLPDIIKSNINDMFKKRDELLEFFEMAFSFKDDIKLFEVVLEYLEGALQFNFAKHSMGSWYEWQFENYRFFNHECFIYLLAFLLHYKRYNLAKRLMNSKFYLGQPDSVGYGKLLSHFSFYSYSEILKNENQQLLQRSTSPTAALFQSRATNKTIDFTQFMQADFVLFLQSLIKSGGGWYPVSLKFASYTHFELFARAETDDGFEVLKILLEINSRDELMNKYKQAIGNSGNSYSDLTFHHNVSFDELMNFERICQIKPS